jgi:MoxR-like ATPase
MTATATRSAATVSISETARLKIEQARTELNARMIERDAEIELALVALIAGEHVLFVGPPGTGKSMLSDAITELVSGSKFSYLMTKFTSPDEVFGPISLAELKAGSYVRITRGKLPEADIAFLDEIFKSSSAILNTMLKALNERVYDDGRGAKKIPLRLCVAASNEWPTGEGQQELGALFDRFVLRRTVRPISSAAGLHRLRFGSRGPVGAPLNAPLSVTLTPAELEAARAAAAELPWSKEAEEAFAEIIVMLNKEGVFPGDRRQVKAVHVASAAAFLEGAAEVQPEHLTILADVLWDSPEEQPKKAFEVVNKIANPSGFAVTSLLVEAEQILHGTDTKNIANVTAAAQKIGEVMKKMQAMKGNPKADKAFLYLKEQARKLRAAAIDATTGGE